MRLKVLISAYACEPGCGSEPEVGWQWAIHMAQLHDVTVITRPNNRPGIEAELAKLPQPHPRFIYHDPAPFWVRLKKKGLPIPLFYLLWQMSVRLSLGNRLNEFDLIHHITFNSFRQPGFWWACKRPVVLGPLGGGQIAPWQLLSIFPHTRVSETVRSLSVIAAPLHPFILLSLASASAILVANADTERRIPRRWRQKVQKMLETGVPPSEVREVAPSREERDEIGVIWVSRFDEIKAPLLALRAFAAAVQHDPRLRLTMIGSGPDHEVAKTTAADLQIADKVTFAGRMPKEQIPAELARHDFFLFTSLRDTSGNVLIEAMAAGLPAICLRHHGAAEISSEETAIRVEPGNVEETLQRLASAMVKLAGSEELRQAMGAKAAERVAHHFLWPGKAKQMSAIYNQVVTGVAPTGDISSGSASKLSALFGGPSPSSAPRNLRILNRGGIPFLFLPREPRAAITVLGLYPAQRSVARLAKTAIATALQLRLPLPLPNLSVSIDPAAPFVRFMAGLIGEPPGALPVWGMLAGNPNAPGQRLVFLVFGPDLKPRAVVKVGQGETARRLITQELGALAALPTGLAGALRLLGQWGDASTAALALPYVSGEAPSPESLDRVAAILNDWLRFGSDAPLDSLTGWRAIQATAQGRELLPLLPSTPAVVRAPVTHGDFAPWNIKVTDGKTGAWTVLDWERGELCGVPAWDWFHFVLQPAALVQKLPAEAIAERAEGLLASPEFRQYAEAARITGLERVLLLGYLVHCTEVIRQTEGAPALSGARDLLLKRWR